MFSLQGEHVFKHLILTKFKKNVKHVLAMAENMFYPIEKTCFRPLQNMFSLRGEHVFEHLILTKFFKNVKHVSSI